MRASAVALFLGLAACGPSGPGPIAPAEVEGPFRWGALANVTHVSHLYFAGQPDRAALERARAEGVAVVVNLREPAEMEALGWDERAAAEALGLEYHNVPVARRGPFSREAFAEIGRIAEQAHPAPVLVHCRSSNRAAAWFVTHLVGEHGMSFEDALAVGRRTGLTKEETVAKARAYLASRSP